MLSFYLAILIPIWCLMIPVFTLYHSIWYDKSVILGRISKESSKWLVNVSEKMADKPNVGFL